MRHKHDWWPAAPIDPEGDRGNVAARKGHLYTKTETFICRCGAQKMELTTNGRINRYVTTANGRLWRGHRWLRKAATT